VQQNSSRSVPTCRRYNIPRTRPRYPPTGSSRCENRSSRPWWQQQWRLARRWRRVWGQEEVRRPPHPRRHPNPHPGPRRHPRRHPDPHPGPRRHLRRHPHPGPCWHQRWHPGRYPGPHRHPDPHCYRSTATATAATKADSIKHTGTPANDGRIQQYRYWRRQHRRQPAGPTHPPSRSRGQDSQETVHPDGVPSRSPPAVTVQGLRRCQYLRARAAEVTVQVIVLPPRSYC
jgi:hypothetical protein